MDMKTLKTFLEWHKTMLRSKMMNGLCGGPGDGVERVQTIICGRGFNEDNVTIQNKETTRMNEINMIGIATNFKLKECGKYTTSI